MPRIRKFDESTGQSEPVAAKVKKQSENEQIKEADKPVTIDNNQNDIDNNTDSTAIDQPANILDNNNDNTKETVSVLSSEQENRPNITLKRKYTKKNEKDVIVKDDFDQLESDLQAYNSQSSSTTSQQTSTIQNNSSVQASSILDGYVLLLLIDSYLPHAIHFVLKLFVKDLRHVNMAEIGLSDSEFKKMEKLADKAAEYVALRMNPLLVLGFAVTGTYTKKILSSDLKNKVKASKNGK